MHEYTCFWWANIITSYLCVPGNGQSKIRAVFPMKNGPFLRVQDTTKLGFSLVPRVERLEGVQWLVWSKRGTRLGRPTGAIFGDIHFKGGIDNWHQYITGFAWSLPSPQLTVWPWRKLIFWWKIVFQARTHGRVVMFARRVAYRLKPPWLWLSYLPFCPVLGVWCTKCRITRKVWSRGTGMCIILPLVHM